MGIPLNIIHFYIGAPLLGYVFIHGVFFAKKSTNIVTRYVAYASGLFAVACLFYSVPVLFTQDRSVLTICTIIADAFQYVSLAVLSLLASQILISRWPVIKRMVDLMVLLLSAVYVYISIRENLAFPTYIDVTDGSLHLHYVSSAVYNFWNGVAFSSLFFLGLTFLSQVPKVKINSQRYRLAALGVLFTMNGMLFPLAAIFKLNLASLAVSSVVGASFILMAIFLILSFLSSRKNQS